MDLKKSEFLKNFKNCSKLIEIYVADNGNGSIHLVENTKLRILRIRKHIRFYENDKKISFENFLSKLDKETENEILNAIMYNLNELN